MGNINIITVIIILAIHWIADFICQTDWQAKNKSKRWDALLLHTSIYSAIWFFVLSFITTNVILSFEFAFITFVAHTITDYFTSRLNSKLWTEGKVHYFFVSVGFDQLLHYIQLLLTFQLLWT